MDERDRPTDADAEPSDGSLVARANRGDRAAFEQLYGRYRDWILAVAYRVTEDRDLAFDVLQEVVVYWLGKFPGFVLAGKVKTFLVPVVRHTALEHLRRRRRGQGLELPEALPDDRPVSLAGVADLESAVARLPPGQREVLLLHFGDGLALAEVAVALEIPLGTVKSRLGLALAALRSDGRLRRAWLGGS